MDKKCETCPIEKIEAEIRACDFECVGGDLGNHRSYIALLARAKKLQAERDDCHKILEEQLDRDKDPKDSLRDLVVVACNALHWVRAKKEHFVLAELQARIKALEAENDRLKGTCMCMDCGEKIKTVEQSKHDKECKKNKALKGE